MFTQRHGLPSGTYREDDLDIQNLPADWGFLIGGELSVYSKRQPNFINLFVKYATGLATVDELEIPTKASLMEKTAGSHEYLVGTSANYETADWGLLWGSYARYYLDSDDNIYDFDDRFEFATALRPTYFATDNFHIASEASVQILRPNGISPVTQEHDIPMAFQLAVMPTLAAGKVATPGPTYDLLSRQRFKTMRRAHSSQMKTDAHRALDTTTLASSQSGGSIALVTNEVSNDQTQFNTCYQSLSHPQSSCCT